MNWKNYIPSRIRHARKEARLTQVQLAEAIGVDDLTISKFECGRILPSVETVERIAQATHLPLDWFFRPPDQTPNERELVLDRDQLVQQLQGLTQALTKAQQHLELLEHLLPAGLAREIRARRTRSK